MEDGTNYFGTIIERRGLYGGNITVRQFALVTAQRVEKPDAGQLYTGLDGVPYLVHERVGRAALNIPAGPLNQNDALYGPTDRIACGTATHLAYDFTVYERTLYIDVRFDGDREAGNIHFDRVLRGGGGLPPDTTAASSPSRVRCITMHSGRLRGCIWPIRRAVISRLTSLLW